jgi:aminoglycoside 2'-N-acetyltransferase I
MMHEKLPLEIIPSSQLSPQDRADILALCSQAFDEDYAPYLESFVDAFHILARLDGQIVSHALWIERWLQVDDRPSLQTAYVEGVATAAGFRGQGFATVVMQRLAKEIIGFDIGALSPADTDLYARLGWEFWQGPLFTRKEGLLIPDPDEAVMILRLPKTPDLDLSLPVSIEWREGEVW